MASKSSSSGKEAERLLLELKLKLNNEGYEFKMDKERYCCSIPNCNKTYVSPEGVHKHLVEKHVDKVKVYVGGKVTFEEFVSDLKAASLKSGEEVEKLRKALEEMKAEKEELTSTLEKERQLLKKTKSELDESNKKNQDLSIENSKLHKELNKHKQLGSQAACKNPTGHELLHLVITQMDEEDVKRALATIQLNKSLDAMKREKRQMEKELEKEQEIVKQTKAVINKEKAEAQAAIDSIQEKFQGSMKQKNVQLSKHEEQIKRKAEEIK